MLVLLTHRYAATVTIASTRERLLNNVSTLRTKEQLAASACFTVSFILGVCFRRKWFYTASIVRLIKRKDNEVFILGGLI